MPKLVPRIWGTNLEGEHDGKHSWGRLRRRARDEPWRLAALAIVGATSARVASDSSGSAAAVWLASKPEFVTFCHVAGREEDPANSVTLTLPYGAVFGQAGHFNEDGTPNAGHEQDHLGACSPPPPPTDVCPNIEGNQATVPAGMVKDEQGNCVTPPPPPTDVCPNIEGNQATVPAGMVKDEQGTALRLRRLRRTCVRTSRATRPRFRLDGEGRAGELRYASAASDGRVSEHRGQPGHGSGWDGEGRQGRVLRRLDGLVRSAAAAPTVKSAEFMDVQVIKDATPQVQLVNGQADIAYTVRVRNNGPNQAHNVVLTDAAPGGVTFLAVTQQPVAGNCTISAALLNCTLGTLGPGSSGRSVCQRG